jgi:hypothetical protein
LLYRHRTIRQVQKLIGQRVEAQAAIKPDQPLKQTIRIVVSAATPQGA